MGLWLGQSSFGLGLGNWRKPRLTAEGPFTGLGIRIRKRLFHSSAQLCERYRSFLLSRLTEMHIPQAVWEDRATAGSRV